MLARSPIIRPIIATSGYELPVYILPFKSSAFDFSAFVSAGIYCPPCIARSIRKRQAEFFHGRLAARLALKAIGVPDEEVGIGDARQPLWPNSVNGSITHSHTLAAALVTQSTTRFVGIDIEETISNDQEKALRTNVFDKEELAVLHTITAPADVRMRLTLAFSAKESLFKGLFREVGYHFGFDAARVISLDPENRRIHLVLSKNLTPNLPAGAVFNLSYDFLHPDAVLTGLIQ